LKSPTVIVTKQGNGNLCFDFKTKEDEQWLKKLKNWSKC
jgi:hypothetical protein